MIEADAIIVQALEEPIGLVVRSNRQKAASQALYQAKYRNPAAEHIGIVLKANGEIWIINRDKVSPEDVRQPTNSLSLEISDD